MKFIILFSFALVCIYAVGDFNKGSQPKIKKYNSVAVKPISMQQVSDCGGLYQALTDSYKDNDPMKAKGYGQYSKGMLFGLMYIQTKNLPPNTTMEEKHLNVVKTYTDESILKMTSALAIWSDEKLNRELNKCESLKKRLMLMVKKDKK